MKRLVVLGIAAGGLTATVVVPAAAQEASVGFGDCPAEIEEMAPDLDCASVQVPLDYADPVGQQISIFRKF